MKSFSVKSLRRGLVTALSIVLASSATYATTKKAAPAAAPAVPSCAGTDLLPDLTASSPDQVKSLLERANAIENSEAVLWRIEKPGVKTSYLFGTMHLSDPRIATLSPKVKDLLGTSSTVILEIADLTSDAAANALAGASRAALYSDDTTLDKILTKDEFAKVRATLDKLGVPTGVAHMFRPWLINMLLASSECERGNIGRGLVPLDAGIANFAREKNIPVAGLESVEEQLDALASIPDEQQLSMLRAQLTVADRSNDLMETAVQLYLQRKTSAIWYVQLAIAEKAGIPATAYDGLKQKLIIDRNVKMADRLTAQLDKGGAFVGVGALHLPGPQGLVSLMRAKGYTVTAVE